MPRPSEAAFTAVGAIERGEGASVDVREVAWLCGYRDVDRHYHAAKHIQKLHLFDECPYKDPGLAQRWREGWAQRTSELEKGAPK